MATLTRTNRKRVVLFEGRFYTAGHCNSNKAPELFINSPAGESIQYRLALSLDEAETIARQLAKMVADYRTKAAP